LIWSYLQNNIKNTRTSKPPRPPHEGFKSGFAPTLSLQSDIFSQIEPTNSSNRTYSINDRDTKYSFMTPNAMSIRDGSLNYDHESLNVSNSEEYGKHQ
jgi:hypothetical protein